jgi:chemotaxis protein methyltransferase CheR
MARPNLRRQDSHDLMVYIHDRLGFRFTLANKAKFETKLRNMQLPAHWPDLGAFRQALLAGDRDAHELLVRTITVNHTFFFREPEQFKAMAAVIKARRMSDPLIWCAASSTGEEAYSIVIHLLEEGISQFRVVASDINPKVLHAMNRGVFHTNRLEHVSRVLLLKYFTRDDDLHWRIKPELRRYVALKRVNLQDAPRFIHPFDFIFCRNVFIYFDEHTRNVALGAFRDNLKVGGLLYLGLTESLLEVPPGFAVEAYATYRRVADN